MKYIKEACLITSGVVGGIIFGSIAVITAELKSETVRNAFIKIIADKITNAVVGETNSEKTHYTSYNQTYRSSL